MAGLLCFIALNALLIISRPSTTSNESVASLPRLSSPFFLYTDNENGTAQAATAATEIPAASIVNEIRPVPATDTRNGIAHKEEEKHSALSPYNFNNTASVPYMNLSLPFVNVAFTEMPALPRLNKYQERQVKEAVDASRKVLEEKQWKVVEQTIADVMTSYEKGLLKDEYEKEMSKVDWERMQDKLRIAYDQIEWNKVNEELNKAMVEIQRDSIRQAYSIALAELSALQKELSEKNLKGIPDTDISLKAVEQGKKEVEKAISNLIRVKAKKVAHL